MPESGARENPQTNPESTEGRFSIQKIYMKDISFETPNSPETFRAEWRPHVDFQLHSDAKVIAPDLYEVVLRVTVTAKLGDETAFLVEVHQAGIFGIAGLPEESLKATLGSFCPNILFPYAREAVSDLVTRGGFPQFLLAPVNFDALYARHQQEAKGGNGQLADPVQ